MMEREWGSGWIFRAGKVWGAGGGVFMGVGRDGDDVDEMVARR